MKKKTTTKKKPAKKGVKPNARLFNPHEPINLDEAWARAQTEDKDPEKARITVADLRRTFEAVKAACESKPAKKPAARPIPPPPPMIRLRLPSEKPTREDGDKHGHIFALFKGASDTTLASTYRWDRKFDGDEIAWFSLPDGTIPREPSQEEKWRAEFEEEWSRSGGSYSGTIKSDMWKFFLAAKEGGAE